jgi:hypothetical protein
MQFDLNVGSRFSQKIQCKNARAIKSEERSMTQETWNIATPQLAKEKMCL